MLILVRVYDRVLANIYLVLFCSEDGCEIIRHDEKLMYTETWAYDSGQSYEIVFPEFCTLYKRLYRDLDARKKKWWT